VTKIDKRTARRLLSEAREALEELKELVSRGREQVLRDRTLIFSMRYSVILMVEALADLSFAILEKDFGECPEGYRDAFARLAKRGVVKPSLAEGMRRLASLRNLIVHRYWAVNDERIYEEAVGGGIGIVEEFVAEVSNYVEAKDP